MADSTISQLPPALSLSPADLIPVDQGGVTKRAPLSMLGSGLVFIAPGKSLTVNNTLTLQGTDGTTMTFPTTSANLARTDAAQTFTGDQSFSNNLNFLGTGNRITGDFSNATEASRVSFATSTLNGSTIIPLYPNGTGTVVGHSSPTVPYTINTAGVERFRVDNSGNIILNSSPIAASYKYIAGYGNRTNQDQTVFDVRAYNSATLISTITQALGSDATSGEILFNTSATGVLNEQARISQSGVVTLGGASTAPAFKIVAVGTQVNYIQAYGRQTNNPPIFWAEGADASIGIDYWTKGTGAHVFRTDGTVGQSVQFQILHTASANRSVTITGSNGGNPTIGVSAGTLATGGALELGAAATTATQAMRFGQTRQLGYAQITATQSGITTQTDVTGLTVTVTVLSGQQVKITFYASQVFSSVSTDRADIQIMEGVSQLQGSYQLAGINTDGSSRCVQVVLTPSAGSHTYKIQASRGVGTGSISVFAAAGSPAYILAEAF